MGSIRSIVMGLALGVVASAATAGPNVAVVELFTSEGCSSCPPADAVVGGIDAEAGHDADATTIVIAWHVDYWNYIGWDDPYSSPQNTERQRFVCRELGSSRIYTPQTVVNGREHFTGSDAAKTTAAIKAVHDAPSPLSLSATATPDAADPRRLTVQWTAQPGPSGKLPTGARIEVIAVEDGLVSEVTRGENAGRTLHHDAVARATATQPLDITGTGRATVTLPATANPAHSRVVVIARAAESMRVLGAAHAVESDAPAAP